MKLMDFLIPNAIEPNLKSNNNMDAIRELVALLKNARAITDDNEIVKAVLEREELGSTGIGDGIAVPHSKSETINKVIAAFGRSEKGIDFMSELDNTPVRLVFLLIAPKDAPSANLSALARISRMLKNKEFREKLLKAKGKSEMLEIFKSED